jgi:hypothetical protein
MTTPTKRPVVEVLSIDGCPHYPAALALVERVRAQLRVDAELRATMVADQAAAEQHRFPGSPTIRVDGHDVEPGAEPPGSYTVSCRLYRHDQGLAGLPREQWVRDALLRAAGLT